jgi:hypothetical protein
VGEGLGARASGEGLRATGEGRVYPNPRTLTPTPYTLNRKLSLQHPKTQNPNLSVGTPWIAAFHCASPAVSNITRCTLDMIATIAILRYAKEP